ncbi:MAG: hypothetical protein PHW77_07420 [Eubacteriales bacterium]|nr:hypothetical protein [Eubacteriales bacterium]
MNDNILNAKQYDFIKPDDKHFIIDFTEELKGLGYEDCGIGNGFCWGRYMIIYRKSGIKSQNVYARIYIRDNGICLRLFFNKVTKHGDYIANTPYFIKSVFTGDYGKCKHCKGDSCKFRKDYEIGGIKYEKCNGYTFEFYEPTTEKLPAYIDLFKTFNCKKGGK